MQRATVVAIIMLYALLATIPATAQQDLDLAEKAKKEAAIAVAGTDGGGVSNAAVHPPHIDLTIHTVYKPTVFQNEQWVRIICRLPVGSGWTGSVWVGVTVGNQRTQNKATGNNRGLCVFRDTTIADTWAEFPRNFDIRWWNVYIEGDEARRRGVRAGAREIRPIARRGR